MAVAYRGILNEPVIARAMARAWRQQYVKGLENIAQPMQQGGRPGPSPSMLHLQARMWQTNGRCAGISTALVFIDIRSAFHSVAKPLLAGYDGDLNNLQVIFKRMGLPSTAFPAFCHNVQAGHIVRSATNSTLRADHAASTLAKTWFVTPGGGRILAPTTGSRPGDPVADVLFCMLYATVLESVHKLLSQQDDREILGVGDLALPLHITWVDDTAIAIHSKASHLITRTAEVLTAMQDTLLEFGLKMAFGPGKTAALLDFRGAGATAARQQSDHFRKTGIPIWSEHLPMTFVPIVTHYKHLGGFIVRAGRLQPELRARGQKQWPI